MKRHKAKAFAHEVSEWLNARTRFGKSLKWSCEHRLAKTGRDYIDVVGKFDSRNYPSILVEIELHREDPVSNVVKIWKWADDNSPGRIVFFQAFSHLYSKAKAEKKQRAIFLGRMLKKEVNINYVPLSLKYSPRAKGRFGAGRRTVAARRLARRVMNHLLRSRFLYTR
jgi:hypothetical protein